MSKKEPVDSITLNQFRDNFPDIIEKVINQHQPLKITHQNGADLIVISAEDWEQEQETLYILQNSSLMEQIATSMATHVQNQGYSPNNEEMDEILSI